MKRRSAGIDELFDEARYAYDTGELSAGRWWLARTVWRVARRVLLEIVR
jgi:hypothetical protein